MRPKKIISWSKRQSGAEVYYRTGGLLSIDALQLDAGPHELSNGSETAIIAGRPRPPPFTIVPHDTKQLPLSPSSASYSTALANLASGLQAVFHEKLRPETPAGVTWHGVVHKPLPGRPRSMSLPSISDFPVELPGSILQENHGFPGGATRDCPLAVRPTAQNIRRETHPPDGPEKQHESLDDINLPPRRLPHISSLLLTDQKVAAMRSVRSANALNAQANFQKVQHKKSLGDVNSRRRSRQDLLASSFTEQKPAACSASTIVEGRSSANKDISSAPAASPSSAACSTERTPKSCVGKYSKRRSEVASKPTSSSTKSTTATSNAPRKQIEELKATISAQDQTISSLQAQFGSLRASNEAHLTTLTKAHNAEVASLKNHARVLEEQLAHRPSLHHASSNNLLFYLDTSEPRTPTREALKSNDTASTSSPKSFHSAVDRQYRTPQRSSPSPEMESLKRKLSTTRRPEVTGRNLLPELNQYKQNNVALQKQIESLMAKLNESKTCERALKKSLSELQQQCDKLEEKVQEAHELTKDAHALQNTIDHLENRLEIANIEKLDAQEQLCNVQASRSPFDFSVPRLHTDVEHVQADKQDLANPHMSMSTIFSSGGSPIGPETESQELSTLAAFVAHIERLQDQCKHKDARIMELETEADRLQAKHARLQQDHNANTLQLEIQNELLNKTRNMDADVEQLRSAIIDREAIIGERNEAVRALERHLDHHKLLLQAEIRRRAVLTHAQDSGTDRMPDLSKVAAQSDIDRWISRLHERLRKEKRESGMIDSRQTEAQDLRNEIDFYIREIIFYKLDIRGYKSDIKKLKRLTAQMSSYGSRVSDLDSETSSIRPSASPRQQPSSTSLKLTALDTSHALSDRNSNTPHTYDPTTPPLSGSVSSSFRPAFEDRHEEGPKDMATTPETPAHPLISRWVGPSDERGLSPHSVTFPSFEQRRPVSPSPRKEVFGDLLTNLPRSTRDVPQARVKRRSSSESTIRRFKESTMDRESAIDEEEEASTYRLSGGRERSASLPESSRGMISPGRPSRPRYGPFDSISPTAPVILSPSRANVFSEAMRRTSSTDSTMPKALYTTSSSVPEPTSGKENYSYPLNIQPSLATNRPNAVPQDHNKPSDPTCTASPPERKLSAASTSSIPFVIGVGSPYNPALNQPPTACSITRNAPLKIPSTSRTGLGGTMASSTPVSSPIYPNETSETAWKIPTWEPATQTQNQSQKSSRKFSLSRKQEEPLPKLPRTPSHSRNVSASSIRTAFRLPNPWEKERDKEDAQHRARKNSISMPQPLGSPFRVERKRSTAGAGEEMGQAF